MAIQILHYEFMGPIRLDEWGPPMEEVVYVLLARNRDKFSPIFVDQCTRSEDAGFFTKNPKFKCWMDQAGSESNLYVAIHPMFGSSAPDRRLAVGKIVSKYSPHCNMVPVPEQAGEDQAALSEEPAQQSSERDGSAPTPGGSRPPDSVKCACCGSEMRLERRLQQSSLYRCEGCGISETRLG